MWVLKLLRQNMFLYVSDIMLDLNCEIQLSIHIVGLTNEKVKRVIYWISYLKCNFKSKVKGFYNRIYMRDDTRGRGEGAWRSLYSLWYCHFFHDDDDMMTRDDVYNQCRLRSSRGQTGSVWPVFYYFVRSFIFSGGFSSEKTYQKTV